MKTTQEITKAAKTLFNQSCIITFVIPPYNAISITNVIAEEEYLQWIKPYLSEVGEALDIFLEEGLLKDIDHSQDIPQEFCGIYTVLFSVFVIDEEDANETFLYLTKVMSWDDIEAHQKLKEEWSKL